MSIRAVARWMPTRRRLMGAIIGGFVAGLVLALWLVVGEAVTHQPSQLTLMERQIAGWFGNPLPINASTATFVEEWIGISGHLVLSAVAAAIYAFIWRRDRSVILNGLMFGATFYIAAHAIVGPILRLTPVMWNFRPVIFLQGCVINGFFGVCTAFFAHQFDDSDAGCGGFTNLTIGRPR